jgi:sec-independent protein translocase protein TatC
MDEGKMTVIEHLEELRWRIIISLLSVLLCSIGGYFIANSVMHVLSAPLGKNKLVYLTPSEGFVTHIQVSLVCGIILASPVVLYQIWAFINPALKAEEKKYFFTFMPLVIFLFSCGVAGGTFFILPAGMKFLINFSTVDLQPMLSVSNYFSFAMSIIVSCGLVFELPLLALLLGKIGLINSGKLSYYRKYAILGAFIIAGVITPSVDMFTQILVAVPVIFLYEGSIILLKIYKL